MLDIKRMRYLDAVYRYKNFTRASEELFVSQPTISTAVANLEQELGLKLISRNSKEVVFTPEGERLIQHICRILKEAQAAEEEMQDLANSRKQLLRLGISSLSSDHIISSLFSKFIYEYPGLEVALDTGPMEEQVEKVLSEHLDLAYNAIPSAYDQNELNIVLTHTAEICLFMRQDHPLAKLERVPIDALNHMPVVMTDVKSKIYRLMSREFDEHLVFPDIITQHDQMLCLLNIVEEGNFMGFVSTINNQHPYGFECMEVRSFEKPITFDVGFITKKGKYIPRIARDFIRFVQQIK